MLLSQEGEVAGNIEFVDRGEAGSEGGFWAKFPEDLIFEILRRLGEKDLILLKSVSKDWNFVISRICIARLSPPAPCATFWSFLVFKDPLPPEEEKEEGRDQLLKLHFLFMYMYGLFMPRILLYKNRYEEYFLSMLPKESNSDPSGIRDCCNGLLLLASSRYYVANPVTKQRISIPINPQHTNLNLKTIHSSLVFDPSLSLDFKIVTFTVTLPLELDIFSSETGQWCNHVLPLEPLGLNAFEWLPHSVCFNRGLYSLSLAMFLVCIDNLIPSPGSRDHDLKAWAIELPDKDLVPSELQCCGCIGVSSGCFYYSNRDVGGSYMYVWMLLYKGRNSKWVLMHTISIADDLVETKIKGIAHTPYWKNFDCFRPRTFYPNDHVLVIASPKLVISYNFKIKLLNELWTPQWNSNRKTLHLDGNWIFPFSPCLLILHSDNLGE